MLAAEVLGCGVHGLLFTLVHEAWLGLLGEAGGAGVLRALLTSATVVVGLSALWPGLPWWGLALASAPLEGERRPSAWEVTLRLGRLLSEDPRARSEAFRAALALHAMFAAPTLGVVLALTLGGWVWAALALMLLLSPILTRVVGRWVLRRYPRAVLGSLDESPAPPRGVTRILAGLALSTAALGLGAVMLLGVPAPTRLAGTCGTHGSVAPASIPGALPGTQLFMEASAAAVTLSAPDGGGPGRVALASCHLLTCRVVPRHATVETREGVQVVTLCPAADEAGGGPAQQLELAPEGYRLDDGIARRVLRSRMSAALALALVLLGFAYSRWGFRALLRWSADESTPSPHARVAVLWALALGGAQLAWLLVTWLGP